MSVIQDKDESCEHNMGLKKPDKKEFIMYDSIYMNSKTGKVVLWF